MAVLVASSGVKDAIYEGQRVLGVQDVGSIVCMIKHQIRASQRAL